MSFAWSEELHVDTGSEESLALSRRECDLLKGRNN